MLNTIKIKKVKFYLKEMLSIYVYFSNSTKELDSLQIINKK